MVTPASAPVLTALRVRNTAGVPLHAQSAIRQAATTWRKPGRAGAGFSAVLVAPQARQRESAAAMFARIVGGALWRVDLDAVQSKYIGETEKNLSRLFDAAGSAPPVLFFDEADALFGRRTTVKDAHDRYANLEIGHLLENLARHRGVVLLGAGAPPPRGAALARRADAVICLSR